jgi:formate C-acetyltransferase
MTDEVKAAVSTQIFSVNQTDKGQGHIIIDYPACWKTASPRWWRR